jgi:hypothetical protein
MHGMSNDRRKPWSGSLTVLLYIGVAIAQTPQNPPADRPSPPSGGPVLAERLPTPVTTDPEGGIDVPGGKVHRGTGEWVNPDDPKDKRKSFYLWVTPAATSNCKDYEWYQFLKAEAKLNEDGTDRAHRKLHGTLQTGDMKTCTSQIRPTPFPPKRRLAGDSLAYGITGT